MAGTAWASVGMAITSSLEVVAAGRLDLGRTSGPAQLSLAWLLAKGPDIIPIPGTKRRSYLEENVAATELELTAADVADLDALFAPGAISGERYPESMLRLVDKG